jgi:alkaline phosphatase D
VSISYPDTWANPFTLGVASGDPMPDGVVLWTRLAPSPLNGGNLGISEDVDLTIEMSTDASFSSITTLPAVAEARYAHSAHVEVTGLRHSTTYYYRFMAGKYSASGKTKTAPAKSSFPPAVNLAVLNCADWRQGFFGVYKRVAEDADLDFVIHLGDYIYEGALEVAGGPRKFNSAIPFDLASFRNRHAEYKTDQDLQAAHATHPWVVTWDDHEVENDYAGNHSWYDQRTFAARRRAAYQAYYEHMPLPRSFVESADFSNARLYRNLSYGDLLQLLVLDTRQYRTKQPCGDELADCDARYLESNDILGAEQDSWLKANLTSQSPVWNVLTNSIFMTEFDHDPGAKGTYYTDGWDGYPHYRYRLFKHLFDNKVGSPIVLTGDIHAAWVAHLKYHPDHPFTAFREPGSYTIATEFIGTSVTSKLGSDWTTIYKAALSANPHIKLFDERNGGYLRCNVTSERWKTDFMLLDDVNDRASSARNTASFEVHPESDPAKREGAKQVYREARVSAPSWIGIGIDGVLRADGPYGRGWYNTDNQTGELYPPWASYGGVRVNPPRWIGIGIDGVLRADGPYERGWYNTDNQTGELYPQWRWP